MAARDALDAEKFTLTTEVDRQRSKLQDINEYLTGELRAKAARLKEVEGQLAAARQELESATVRAQVRRAGAAGGWAVMVLFPVAAPVDTAGPCFCWKKTRPPSGSACPKT